MDVRDIPLNQIPRQAACPDGQLGVAVADLMAHLNENLYHNALAMVPLALPAPEVLEVGFGCGRFRQILQAERKDAQWVGLEKSATMVQIAKLLPAYEVEHGVVEHLPFDDRRFGAVVALNTLCWWDEPMIALVEIQRVLAPGGVLIVNIIVPNEMTKQLEPFGPRYYKPEQVAQMIELAGFTITSNVTITETLRLDEQAMNRRYVLIVASKS